MTVKTIAIGCDHAGFEYKQALVQYLETAGYQVHDFGTHSADSVDYPDFAHPTAQDVADGHAEGGILICGSGNGVAMTANKHQSVRCALAWEPEIARLARTHNNANMVAIPARFVSIETATAILETFLQTDFEGGRHEARVKKMACL